MPLRVHVVANAALRVPVDPLIVLVVVKHGFDAADDWIVDRIGPDDIAITSDIPLAERCLTRGARVLSPRSAPFSEERIGEALATRALWEMLRQSDINSGGPPPFSARDRSNYLAQLDQTIQALKRRRGR